MNNNTKKRKKKKGYNNKSWNRDNRKTKYYDDAEYKEDSGVNPTNDPSWYAQYPELMRDSASLPYSIPTGTYVKWNVVVDSLKPLYVNSSSIQNNPHQSVPGIMTFGIVPTPGISKDATSPINVAAKMLYTKVRAENSGAKNYDPADLMLYCLAMDQVYSMITWFNRVYGTMMLYSQVNRYLPKAMLEAQWVDFDDLIMHINDFKAFLDTATAQAAVFSVPGDMKIFNRHAFMYQNVYKDAESPKAQMYQFAPRIFYFYDEMNGAGQLKTWDIIYQYPNKLKFADFFHLFHKLLDPIVASEDFNIMSGDILKAFGEGNLLKLQLMPSGYTIIPITDYEVLTQMKNATMTNLTVAGLLGADNGTLDWSIHQDANVEFIEWNPWLTYHNATPSHDYSHDRYLSTYKSAPEPADNMVYSRLMYVLDEVEHIDSGNTYYDMQFNSVGSEFVSGVGVTQFHYDNNGAWVSDTTLIHTISEVAVTSLTPGFLYRIFLGKHFDYCPAFYVFWEPTTPNTFFYPWFDLDNWTLVHAYELEKMHRTAIMSMLRVPMIGSALPSNTGNFKK